jgi:hypothetical protein
MTCTTYSNQQKRSFVGTTTSERKVRFFRAPQPPPKRKDRWEPHAIFGR